MLLLYIIISGNYSIPRLVHGFKGEKLPCFKLPVLKTRQSEIDTSRYTIVTMDSLHHNSNTTGKMTMFSMNMIIIMTSHYHYYRYLLFI